MYFDLEQKPLPTSLIPTSSNYKDIEVELLGSDDIFHKIDECFDLDNIEIIGASTDKNYD